MPLCQVRLWHVQRDGRLSRHLDEWLANAPRPSCNSTYAGCWCDRRAWLDAYLQNLPSYCSRRFDRLPQLDLSSLMFQDFSDMIVPRIRQTVEMAATHLIPLTKENLHERTFHMLLGFPERHRDQLAASESQIVWQQSRVSLNPTCVAYVDNADFARLDLTLSLAGFGLQDHVYLGVFASSQPHD